METTKHKVGRVLLIITLIITFLGCMLMAITLPFLSTVGVVSADSSVIANNLLTDSDFNTWDLNTSYTGGSFYNIYNDWWINATTNQSTISFTDNGYGELVVTATGVRNLFQPMKKDDINWGTKYNFYISIDGDVLGNVVQFADSEPSSTTTYEFFQGSEVWLRFTYWPNGLNLGSQVIYGGWFISFRVNFSGVLNWVKAENTDSFTGYVSQEVYNNIYGQGYSDGVSFNDTLVGYSLVGNLSTDYDGESTISNGLLSWNFTFGGDSYKFVPSSYVGEGGDFAYFTTNSSVDYTSSKLGIKVSSPFLYGFIKLVFPIWFDDQNYFDVLIEDTVTGDLIRITNEDTVHWSFVNFLAYTDTPYATTDVAVYDSWQVCMVDYYCANLCNLYFLPHNNSNTYDNGVIRYPSSPYFNLYTSKDKSILSSFDEGYQAGKKDGIDSVDTDSYYNYGYRQGYYQGHTDGVAEYTDYSFLGLISAVIDAPVKAFSGLLEFEILGVNLKNFVLGLLTLAVIIIIIKIALGGK